MSNLICEFSGTSLKTPVTLKGHCLLKYTVLPIGFELPKYFLAVLSESTMPSFSTSAFFAFPAISGKENSVRKEESTRNILFSLNVMVFALSSVYDIAEAPPNNDVFTARAKLTTSGNSAFMAGPTAGWFVAVGPKLEKLPVELMFTRYKFAAFL